jgi:hypothetical protein
VGYPTKVQLIKRKEGVDQWYINFPTAVAQAMEFERGEIVEWLIEDKRNLVVHRTREMPSLLKKKHRKASSENSTGSGTGATKPLDKSASGREPKRSR